MAHTHKRWQILRGFFNYGFRSFAALCTVCLSLDSTISTLKLSLFWRNQLPAEDRLLFYNRLENILEALRNE